MWKKIMILSLAAALCGCIKIKDELTLNADGSGTVRLETVSSLPAEYSQGMSMARGLGGGEGGATYPPLNESEARKFFPAKDFTMTVKAQRDGGGGATNIIEAAFKDINALLASPYGRTHQLSVKIADGSLIVRAVSGMEMAARLAEMKDENGMIAASLPGLANLQNKTNEMRGEFRITLPNAVSTATGTHDGKTAAWLVERAKCKDADDFASQLGTLCEARCPAEGLKFSPLTPLRLGLLPFAELAAGVADTGPAVDTNQIAAAAKYVPYGLTITRSLDLSGEGGAQPSTAELTGAVTIPPELAPQKWGQPKLDEAVDAKGANLKPADSDDNFGGRSYSYHSESFGGDDEDAAAPTNNSHVVSLTFRSPDWKVKEITRVKGSVSLNYFGGAQVVKLTNSVPAAWIMDMTRMTGGRMSFDSSEKNLVSDALAKLGLSVTVQMGIVQNGMTMLNLQTSSKGAALMDAQVFDASGHPWPTSLQQQESGGMGDTESCQIIVAGKPQAPLSLALAVSGNGASVNVPILVEHVSISK